MLQQKTALERVNSTRVAMALFLLLLLACIYYAKSQESQCVYQYLEQPPLDVICDPYNPQSTGLSLKCQVLAFSSSSSYTVGWFYYPTNHDGATPQRPISVTSAIRDRVSSATSMTTITLTLRPLVDGSSPGYYYCQVIPSDQSETIPSDNFTLYAPEDNHYLTFLICDSMKLRFKNEVRCAVSMGEDVMNITGIQPPQNDGDPVTTDNDFATVTSTNVPSQGDEPLPPVNNSTMVMSLSTTEAINSSTTVTRAESGEEGDSNKSFNAMLYQIYAYVLTPVFLVILIVLVTTIAACLGRKCACHSKEQQKKAEENRTRDGQTGLGGLSQLRQSFHRVLRSQPMQQPKAHTSSPLSSLSLQLNPSYLENSRNMALLQSRRHQASPILETQRQIQKPDPCRRDITRQENLLTNGGSLASYEDNSYVIVSSGTNSTYQSSGAYESML